ncbi:MAG: redox-regulated ATPase YchF [Deltaproteobacteria bacterium]|nr:redox-regulated ATPase YchF [Deltaproteobacteria bacterium]
MSLNAGIVGLPNVGKSCIFNALTQAGARVESFPFSTIEPNHGVVAVPDARLGELARVLAPPKLTPATLELVDVAGLVEGAHRGEGLGNQFLGHIRELDALVHVLRCFGGDVAHVSGSVDPGRDLDVVEIELALADLETVERRLEKVAREAKVGIKEARAELPALERFAEPLRAGKLLRRLELGPEGRAMAQQLGLLTAKPVLYVANVDEQQAREPDAMLGALGRRVQAAGDRLLPLCAQMEAEIALLDDPAERAMFLDDLGLREPGLDRLAREIYALLGLMTFYTFAGGKELRAWPIRRGTLAPQAAGKIHSDFERGFIRADVGACEDFVRLGSEAAARDRGRLRSEGREYEVQDGDVIHFRFNV